MVVPNISAAVLAKALAVWNETIDQHGRLIQLIDMDGKLNKTVKAFCKRPKILGLFDRTQQSLDQERYMVLLKASDFAGGPLPEKFIRASWDEQDHVFLSITEVELSGTVFGYRVLVKG
jgi:hypothetical protein